MTQFCPRGGPWVKPRGDACARRKEDLAGALGPAVGSYLAISHGREDIALVSVSTSSPSASLCEPSTAESVQWSKQR